MQTETAPLTWAQIGPKDRCRIWQATDQLRAAGDFEVAADLIAERFTNAAWTGDGVAIMAAAIARLRSDAAEMIEDAHDRMTPDEWEACLGDDD